MPRLNGILTPTQLFQLCDRSRNNQIGTGEGRDQGGDQYQGRWCTADHDGFTGRQRSVKPPSPIGTIHDMLGREMQREIGVDIENTTVGCVQQLKTIQVW